MKQRLPQLAPWLAGAVAVFSLALYVVFVVLALEIERRSSRSSRLMG